MIGYEEFSPARQGTDTSHRTYQHQSDENEETFALFLKAVDDLDKMS